MNSVRKPKCVLIYGVPGSGKSTLAKKYLEQGYYELNRDNIRFGVVKPGGDWTTWNGFRKGNKDESIVSVIWDAMLSECARQGKDIVITDTNCSTKRREILKNKLERLHYDVFFVRLEVSLGDLLERDKLRGKMAVGVKVVTEMYEKLNKED